MNFFCILYTVHLSSCICPVHSSFHFPTSHDVLVPPTPSPPSSLKANGLASWLTQPTEDDLCSLPQPSYLHNLCCVCLATGNGPSPAPASSQHHAQLSAQRGGFSPLSSMALIIPSLLHSLMSIQTFLVTSILKNFPVSLPPRAATTPCLCFPKEQNIQKSRLSGLPFSFLDSLFPFPCRM